MDHIKQTVTVNRPAREVYAFWRNLENLPRFMSNLREVQSAGTRSHWIADGPMGNTVEWDAEIIEDKPGELLVWRTVADSGLKNFGSVHFREVEPGSTEVSVSFAIDPPGGRVATAIAALLGADPEEMVFDDLQRFKQVLETGQIARPDEHVRS